MRYAFIENHSQEWPVSLQCRLLEVTRSGFYAWRHRETAQRVQREAEVTEQIRRAYVASRQTYGAPRIHQELLAQGRKCNRKTVAKYMRKAGIAAKTHRRLRIRTTDSNHTHPIAQNILNRNFTASRKNEIWLMDITYIPTREGWLYLAAVEDLYTRQIVGWSMSDRIDSRLVVDALEMALLQRTPGEPLIVHSDRGVQYASEHCQRLLQAQEITCSMSRKGDCWDNAPMESFFATVKKELVHHETYLTRAQARQSLFEYIEVFYNRTRRHSALGYLTPAQFAEAI